MEQTELPKSFKPWKILKDKEVKFSFKTEAEQEQKMADLFGTKDYQKYSYDFQTIHKSI